MNANTRKVHRTLMGFGVACAVAAALPCVAGEDPGTADKPLSQEQVKPPSKAASKEANIGFFGGLAIGAVAGGPIGAVAGGVTGLLVGEHYHKQKADRAKLTQTAMQLAASLDHARELGMNINFRTADATLTPQDIDQLTALGQLAGAMPGVKIQVSGYADPRGSEAYNQELSKDRADSVAAVLTNAGMDQGRIVIEALGTNGASKTGNTDDYAFQRRVRVKVLGSAEVADTSHQAADTLAQAQ